MEFCKYLLLTVFLFQMVIILPIRRCLRVADATDGIRTSAVRVLFLSARVRIITPSITISRAVLFCLRRNRIKTVYGNVVLPVFRLRNWHNLRKGPPARVTTVTGIIANRV